MVESTALEMRRTRKGTVGSNPTLSATASKMGRPVPFRQAGDFIYFDNAWVRS